jgi:hypothetical protein
MAESSNFTLYTSNSAEGRSCETKPIPVVGRGPRRRNAPNKAKLERSGVSGGRHTRGACRVKQSQFASAAGRDGGRSYQTKPIQPAPPGGIRSGDAGAGQLYKQSQFRRPGYPTVPLFYHSTIPARYRSCDIASMPRFGKQTQFGGGRLRQTNPIWPVGRDLGGRNARNEPNLRQDSGDEESGRDCVEQSQLAEA